MSNKTLTTTKPSEPKLLGYTVMFSSARELLVACAKVRDAGLKRWDAHTPYPVHGLNDAMGLRPSILAWIVLVAGLTGLGLALLMQWWMNAVDYPYIISGKPMFSLPANIPVIFEVTVLFSAFAAFFGMLGLNGLPQLNHFVFEDPRMTRATDDRFFISVDARDRRFDVDKTRVLLEGLEAGEFSAVFEPAAIEKEAHHEEA